MQYYALGVTGRTDLDFEVVREDVGYRDAPALQEWHETLYALTYI